MIQPVATVKYLTRNIFVLFAIALLSSSALSASFSPQRPSINRANISPATGNGFFFTIFRFPQGSLHQYRSDEATAILEGGTLAAGTAILGISFPSRVFIPLRLQVEVRPTNAAFTGVPTAAGNIFLWTQNSAVAMHGLANGGYHWRARLQNVLTGAVSGWQEFGVPGNTDFTVALREPVVIIPGIAGTALQKTSDGSEAWPNVDTMIVSPSDDYLDALMLNTNGDDAQSTIRAAGILSAAAITVGGIVLFSDDFYGNLIGAFKNDGYVENRNLFTAPYDWRLDINRAIPAIAAKIAQAAAASPTGKIDIIAHSMGGLVLKKYLAEIPNAPFLDKVILAGVPQLGAPDTFKILNYGDDLGIPVVNGDEIKKIAQNMPSLYQLLPSRKYVAENGGYVQDFRNGGEQFLDYDATANVMTSDSADRRNAGLLNAADAFHDAIDDHPIAAPDVYNIVGCGKPTITGFDLYDDGVINLRRAAGDGTVPETSAMDRANQFHNYFVMSGETGIDHTGLTSDARPVTLIKNIIEGVTAPLPQGISASTADCVSPQKSATISSEGETTLEFSTHGSADLGVYNAENQYTGITASGTVALGIPGSEYEKLGDNAFILVPAGNNYRAINQATASGTFDMKVKGYRGGAIDRQATYLSVPQDGTSSIAELDFSGFGKNIDLKTGRKSRPKFEKIRHPDAILSAPDAINDFTPPVILVSALPRAPLLDSTATISFSAVDGESGVASIAATMNDVPVSSGDNVTFTKLGKNIFIIRAIDKAGSPRVKKIYFEVRSAAIRPRGDGKREKGRIQKSFQRDSS